MHNICVSASAKSTKCEGDGLITQANAHGVTRESSVCHNDGAMKNKSMMHKGFIGQGRGGLDQCKRVHQNSIRVFLEQDKAHEGRCSITAARQHSV